MTEVVLVDLDGCLADTTHRTHLAPTVDPNSSWPVYAQACIYDEPIKATIALVEMLYPTYAIHIVSGRDGSALEETKEWLASNNVRYDKLTLRPHNCEASNMDVKVSYIKQIREEGHTPVLLIDDWRPSCKAAESVGVPAIQVGNMERLEPDGGEEFKGGVL